MKVITQLSPISDVRARLPSPKKDFSLFSLMFLSQFFAPTPQLLHSLPIYTLLWVGASWWVNILYVIGPFRLSCMSGFFSLGHCWLVSNHVSVRWSTLWGWSNLLVTYAQHQTHAWQVDSPKTLSRTLSSMNLWRNVLTSPYSQLFPLQSSTIWAVKGSESPWARPKQLQEVVHGSQHI